MEQYGFALPGELWLPMEWFPLGLMLRTATIATVLAGLLGIL